MAHVRRGRAQATAGRAGGRGGALGGGVRSAALGDVGLARRGPGRDGGRYEFSANFSDLMDNFTGYEK